MARLWALSITYFVVILFEISALTDIKIVSFEDIARTYDLSAGEDDTQIVENAKETSLKDNIMSNRIKAMMIAQEVEREKQVDKELNTERKKTEDESSGENYNKFINHLINVKNAASHVAFRVGTKNNKKTPVLSKETVELTIEQADVTKQTNDVTTAMADNKGNTKERNENPQDDDIKHPIVKFENFLNLNNKAPSRTIPDTKFITTTVRSTKYKTDIPAHMKRKFKKYVSEDKKEKTKPNLRANIDEKKSTLKNNSEAKKVMKEVLWQVASVSNESSLEQ